MNVYRWSLIVGIILSYFSSILVAHAECTTDTSLAFQISSSGCTGENVTVTISGTPDNDYDYFFIVDGTPKDIGVNTFTFSTAGEKSIILVKEHKTLADQCFTNGKKIKVSVPPTISFTINNTSAQCSGSTLSFAPNFTELADYNLLWEFGDNKTSTATNPTHKFSAKGGSQKSFTVSLTATHKISACKRSVSQTISVKEIPDIKLVDPDNFEIESFKNCENLNSINPNFTVLFKDASTASTMYSIDWGDGTTASGAKTTDLFTHTYSLLGIYEITFNATGANGCSDTKKYTVYNISNPAIGASLPAGTQDCSPFDVSFSINANQNDPSTIYKVDVGDGTPPTIYNHPMPSTITHTYTKTSCGQPNNSFVFSVEAQNGCDNSMVTLGPIKIFSPPKADVEGPVPALVCVNTPVTFQNKSLDGANNSCSPSASYEWNFGDGTILFGITTKSSQTHSYTQAGTYTVKLKASNNKCGFTEDTFQITVCEGTSISSFDVSNNGISIISNSSSVSPAVLDLSSSCAPITINLVNTANEKCNITYLWSVINPSSSSYSFGGTGTTSSLKNPNSVTFSQGGNYTLRLQTTNICGTTESFVKVIIGLPPQGLPVVAVNPTYCQGQDILASSSSVSGATSYAWTITGLSGTPNPTLGIPPLNSQSLSAFQLPAGSYKLTVVAANNCGTVTGSKDIVINPIPTVQMTPSTDKVVCLNTALELTASTTGTSYQWMKDGVNIVGATNNKFTVNTSITGNSGSYRLAMTLLGCAGYSAAINVTIKDQPTVAINSLAPNAFCKESDVTATLNATPSIVGSYTYTWLRENIVITGATSSSLSVTQRGKYVVRITDGVCSANSPEYEITVFPASSVNINSINPIICEGQSTTLTASGASTYVWSPSDGLNTTNGSSVIASPAVTTDYTVTSTNSNNCQQTKTYKVTVNPRPTVVINSSENDLCFDTSATLTASGAATYSWSPALGLNATTGAQVVATPNQTTTYTITGISSAGCLRSGSFELKVRPRLPAAITSSNSSFCTSGDVEASLSTPAQTGLSYQWTRNNVDIPSATNAQFEAKDLGTYSVKVSDGKCNLISPPFELKLFPRLPLAINPASPTICFGENITIAASGYQNFTWTSNATSTAGSSITVSPPSTVDYKLEAIDANGCTDELTFKVIVNDLPVFTATTTDDEFCLGESETLTAAGAETYSYRWTPTIGLTAPNAAVTSASPTTSTTYSVTGTSTAGCTSTREVTLVVLSLPVLSAGVDATYCIDYGKVDLMNNIGLGPLTGVWSGGGVSDNTFDPQVAGVNAHTLTYTVKNNDTGCSQDDFITLTVKNIPTINFEIPPTACKDVPLQVVNQTSDFGTNTMAFAWDFDNGQKSTAKNPSVTYAAAGDYTISLSLNTSPDYCSATLSKSIEVLDPPIVTATASLNELCVGESTTLTADGATSYVWSPVIGLELPNAKVTGATPDLSTTYSVTGTDNFGCKASATVAVTVFNLPDLSAGKDVTYCNNYGLVDLLSNEGQNPAGGVWSGMAVTDNKFNPAEAGVAVHELTYTVENTTTKCTNSDRILVTVKEPPNVNFQIPENLCRDESLTIVNTTAAFTGNTFSYNWDFGNGTSSTTKDPTVLYSSVGEFNIKLKVSTTPDFCSNEIAKLIKVRDLPVVTAAADKEQICFGESAILTATGADTYAWTPIDGLSSATSAVTNANPTTTTSYIVTGANTFGCKSSDNVNVKVLALPNLDAGADVTYCVNYGPVPLLENTGLNPLDGVWSGVGVADDNFDPQLAGVGLHTLTYTVKDGVTECVNSDLIIVTVKDPPQLNFEIPERICKDATLSIINTTPEFAGNTLSYTWEFGNGGSSTTKNPSVVYTSAGDYLIKMAATTAPDNCFKDFSKSIQVIDPPSALFGKSVDKNTLCGPITIAFDNKSTGTELTHTWNFDNGKTSNSVTPEAIEFVPNPFNDTTYVVSLKVVSAEKTCAPAEYKETITLNPNPTANFLFTQDPICADYPLPLNNFSFGKPLLFRWDFGDGSAIVEKTRAGTIEHVFRNTGIKDTVYQVTLVAINDCGQNLLTRAITVTPNKVDAFYEAQGVVGCEPFSVAFKSNQIPSTKNEIIWEWGDGTFSYGELNPTHMFEKDGLYSPKLIVRNGCNVDTCSVNTMPSCGVTIEVKDSPTPFFAANDPVCFGQDVIIENKTVGQITGTWNFGDGTIKDDLQSPNHSYSAVGTYPIEHRVTYSNSCEASYILPVEVLSLPVPSFNIEEVICEGKNFTSQNTSTNAQSFLWRINLLNSPVYSTSVNYTTSVPNYGNYRLNLFAFTEAGQSGCTDSTSQVISVGRVPDLEFDFSTLRKCDSTFVYVTNHSTFPSPNDGIYAWDINEIETSSEFEPDEMIFKYSQNEETEVQITLASTSVNGCSNRLSKPLVIPAFNEQIFVPSQILCFTPNDPNNGFFKLKTETALQDGFMMNIYGQWGNEVFKTGNRDGAWDGFYLGQVAPLGNYLANVKYRGCSTKNYYELRVPLCLIGSSN